MLSDRDEGGGGGEIEALDEVLCGFESGWAHQQESRRHRQLQDLLSDVPPPLPPGPSRLLPRPTMPPALFLPPNKISQHRVLPDSALSEALYEPGLAAVDHGHSYQHVPFGMCRMCALRCPASSVLVRQCTPQQRCIELRGAIELQKPKILHAITPRGREGVSWVWQQDIAS